MRMQFVIRRFSLVEITLALAILGIGIASIMVLFPVGINANTSAVADNNVADIAEYLLGYVQKQVDQDFYNGKSMSDTDSLIGSLPSSCNQTNIESFDAIPGLTNLKKASTATDVFRYEQASEVNGETVVDFSAEARMWGGDVGVTYRDWTVAGAPYKAGTISKTDNYERLVYLETSWPGDVPYKVGSNYPREKRTFLLDVFNPAFSLNPVVGSSPSCNGVF